MRATLPHFIRRSFRRQGPREGRSQAVPSPSLSGETRERGREGGRGGEREGGREGGREGERERGREGGREGGGCE